MGQNLSNLVRMPKFFVRSGLNFINEFRGPLATSITHKIWVLAMFRGFGQIGTKYGRGCPAGTGGRSGSGIPTNVRSLVIVTGHSLYLEIKFHKKYP